MEYVRQTGKVIIFCRNANIHMAMIVSVKHHDPNLMQTDHRLFRKVAHEIHNRALEIKTLLKLTRRMFQYHTRKLLK